MAKTTTVTITDDLDGSKDASEVGFSFNGINYTIDLSKKNAAAMEKALKPYLDAATKVPNRSGGRSQRGASKSTGPRSDLAAIREWARGQGLEVSERGRVSAAIVEAYDAAR